MRCSWTINLVTQVHVWSLRNSLMGRSFLSLPLSMGTSSTSCQQLKITNVPMMVTRVLTLVGWGLMRRFHTYHRAWLTWRLTLLSSQSLKVWLKKVVLTLVSFTLVLSWQLTALKSSSSTLALAILKRKSSCLVWLLILRKISLTFWMVKSQLSLGRIRV